MYQFFFQFDWQTGHNIIFNRLIMGLTPILVHSWGPEQGFRVCFPYKAEVFKFRLRFVFKCRFEGIWACLEICLNLWYKEYYTPGAPVYTYFVSLGPFPVFFIYFDESPREYSTNIWV